MSLDWKRYVRSHLPPLRVSAEREIEIVDELAAQLEAIYTRARANGASESEALLRVSTEVPDWSALAQTLGQIEPPDRSRIPDLPPREGLVTGCFDDLRYATRSLLTWRGLPTAVVMLGLTITALTTVFAAAETWILRPVPFADPERVAIVWGTNREIGQARDVVSGPTFLDWQRQAHTLDRMAAFTFSEMTVRRDGHADIAGLLAVTPEFFDVLGVRAAAGRTFRAADVDDGANRVAMISYGTWQSQFGGDPSIVGRTLADIGQPHTIVGVLPADFRFFTALDFVSLLRPADLEKEARSYYYYWVIGRLGEGRSIGEAQAELNAIMTGLSQQYPSMRGWTATIESLTAVASEPIRPALAVLLATASLVLLIGVGNTLNLVATRALQRSRDLAIRLALGATWRRVRRQAWLEGVMVASAGALLGLVCALGTLRIAAAAVPRAAAIAGSAATVELPPLTFGIYTAVFLTMVAGVVAIALGTMPIANPDLAALKGAQATASTTPMMTRGRRWLLITQTAISTLLVSLAGLLLMLVIQLVGTSPGFEASDVTSMIVGRVEDLDAPARARYYTEVLRHVADTPGVMSAALNDYVPLTNEDDYEGVEIPGRAQAIPGQVPREEWRRISPSYFNTMSVRLLRGRQFNETDDERAASVVIVNEAMARKYWPDADPIGQRLRITSRPYGWSEVIGVVDNILEAGLDRGPKPMMFVPYQRAPRPVMGLFVKTIGQSSAMTAAIRQAVWSVDPTRPVFAARTMSAIVRDSYAIERSTFSLAAALSLLALVLTAFGMYAVVNLMAVARAPEIGLRKALGASSTRVLFTVLGQPCRSAVVGIAIGLTLSAFSTRAIRAAIIGLPAFDLSAGLAVAVSIALVVVAACLAPAVRVLRVDPLVALRHE